MSTKVILPILVILTVCFASCNSRIPAEGNWTIAKVKIWDNYRTQVFSLDDSVKSVSYTGTDSVAAALFSSNFKDSLLRISNSSYLHLNPDGTFRLNDQGFLTQALSDNEWQGVHEGRWTVNSQKSILNLIQTSSIKKRYRILNLTKEQMVLGELYEDEQVPITEITLQK